ncbi:fasciclin domain-containing protein [Anabaena catenula]|uniref:Fasciclin domain-containing protein n=1 Tax=Anabaena catenula FACHB-362 TaxID=2692877 RepID=A0ABR8J0G6_9NOST|nr:fasciclin domain-containing protein [Anabaena catenula]MBD2691585.1 fasciclin domain-containing protein [Anabaena catenula FACHB-362]
MNANYSKSLTKFAGIVGITGFSLLITLPSQAKEVLNPQPSIFNEAPYNRSQRIQENYQPLSTEKGNTKGKIQVKQKGGSGVLNPRPSIFNEPRYRGRNTSGQTQPGKTDTEVPTTPGTQTPVNTPPQPTQTPASTTQTKNLVEIAESNGSFTTLIKALNAAGLTEVLKGKGPFTIFAPTDAAFAKLPQDAVQDLLKEENKEVLVKVLTYHVVPGKVLSTDLKALSTDLKAGQVKSLQGDSISVKVDPEKGVFVNDAQVTKADIQGSNGVIHVIDTVILPPSL